MSSLTVEDAESSFLKGKAEFEDWLTKFLIRWYTPRAIDMLGTFINTMPAKTRMIAPMESALLEKFYRSVRGG